MMTILLAAMNDLNALGPVKVSGSFCCLTFVQIWTSLFTNVIYYKGTTKFTQERVISLCLGVLKHVKKLYKAFSVSREPCGV